MYSIDELNTYSKG